MNRPLLILLIGLLAAANATPSQAVPRRVREALDILADGLMIIGLDERILLANTALSEVAGHDPEEMLGKHAASLGFRVAGMYGFPPQKAFSLVQPS